MATPTPKSSLDPNYTQWQIENPGYEIDDNGQPVKRPTNADGSPQTESSPAEDKTAAAAEAQRIAAEKARAAAIAQYESRFQYGGNPGGAHEAANRYATTGQAGQQRQGEVINYGNANYNRAEEEGARREQVAALNLMRARAEGRVPSIAGMQANRDIGRAVADQSSIAASARGPAGLALAQQQSAANSANAISGISNQAQINAAQERERAEAAFFGAGTGIRGGDMQAGAMAAQQAQQQAAINAAQRQQNDQYQLGMTQAEIDVQKSQLAAQQQKIAIETGQAIAAANRASAESMHDDDRIDKYIVGGAAVAGAAAVPVINYFTGGSGGPDHTGAGNAGSGTPGTDPLNDEQADTGGYNPGTGGGSTGTDYDPVSDERTKRPASLMAMRARGGPVRPGKSYLVGEEGPEIIVPAERGRVLTAAETRDLLDDRRSTAVGRALAAGPQEPPKWLTEHMSRPEPSGPVDELDEPVRDMGELDEPVRDLGDIDAQDPNVRDMGELVDTSIRQPVSFERPLPPGAAEMLEAARAQRPELSPSTAAALRRDSPLEEDRTDRYAREVAPSSLMAMRARRATTSDDRAKLAAAWDQGHAAGIANVEKASRWTPEDIKKYSEGDEYKPEAATVRSIKARAYDEGFNQPREAAPEEEAPPQDGPAYKKTDSAATRAQVLKDWQLLHPQTPVPPPAAAKPAQPVAWSPLSRAVQARASYSDERAKVGTLGPQVPSRDMAAFARSMHGTPYSYRDEYADREGQKRGEVNVGPVAQEMERSKVGRTIVKPSPDGMRTLDQSKMVKALGSLAADQQDQIDEQEKRISLMARRIGSGR